VQAATRGNIGKAPTPVSREVRGEPRVYRLYQARQQYPRIKNTRLGEYIPLG